MSAARPAGCTPPVAALHVDRWARRRVVEALNEADGGSAGPACARGPDRAELREVWREGTRGFVPTEKGPAEMAGPSFHSAEPVDLTAVSW